MSEVIFSNETMPLINYELGVMNPKQWKEWKPSASLTPKVMHPRQWKEWKPSASLNAQLACIDKNAMRARESKGEFFLFNETNNTLFFHPGRVLVSHEVMVRLGKMQVLFYLNCFVRGVCSVGAIEYDEYLADPGLLSSRYWFSEDIHLHITVNAARTCTLIRFSYERLVYRRLGRNPKPCEPAYGHQM